MTLPGLFEENEYDKIPYQVVECKEHLELARKVAEESFVLLKNDGILPLKKEEIKTIGIVGPNANSRAALIGNYHGAPTDYITIQDGISKYVGDDIRVLCSVGSDLFRKNTESIALEDDRLIEAKIVADESDVVILCLGLDETLEGEEGDTGNSYASGDKETLSLPKSQVRLMEALAETGKPVILCMLAGSDIDLSFAREHFSAIMQVWYPGGRTYRYMKGKAQYPFGFGLTYGNAKVLDAMVEGDMDCGYTLRATVENTGDRDIREVLQVYVKKEDSKWDTPNPSLGAFKKFFIKKGEKKQIEVSIPYRAFTVVDDTGKRFVDGNAFRFYVGFSQPDEKSVELMKQKPLVLRVEV